METLNFLFAENVDMLMRARFESGEGDNVKQLLKKMGEKR